MAYKIKKETNAYYFIYTFECEDPAILNEFRRLANISDKVIRCLMINIEKSYGYNASVNPKKQATSAIMKKKYNKHQEE
jgi:small subunit ribosomal protein S6